MKPQIQSCLRALLAALSVLLLTGVAVAAGRLQWTQTTIQEREDQAWKVEVAIFLPKAPDVPYVPMKFEFQQVTYFARDRVDGDTPEGKVQERRVPVVDKQPLIEGVDVGFLDPSTGQAQSRTKFSFKLTRGHGYEAGEYRVTIRDTRDGRVVGTPTKLVFNGQNEIVDRRTMVFGAGDAPKKKQMKTVDREGSVVEDGAPAKPAESASEPAEAAGAEHATQAESEPEGAPPAAAQQPAGTLHEKPGACGCTVPGRQAPASVGLVASLGLAALALRRRAR